MTGAEISYVAEFRPSWALPHVPMRPGWFVVCRDHPKVGLDYGHPWAYARKQDALAVQTRHNRKHHGS